MSQLRLVDKDSQLDYGKATNGFYTPVDGKRRNKSRAPVQKKRRKWPWIFLVIILLVVIIGAVLGGFFGSRKLNKDAASPSSSSGSGSGPASGPGSTISAIPSTLSTKGSGANAVLPTGTDAWGQPLYPTTASSAQISAPTLVSSSALSCGSDPYSFGGNLAVRDEHPRLWAPSYKWSCLPKLIASDPYMAAWNETIFLNASRYYGMSPTNYSIDGGFSGSGVLDVAREVKVRLRHWGYAWKLSNDTKWVDRSWLELTTAAGNATQYFGQAGDNWNQQHFLDLAEFTAAFGLAYDWMYDAWTDTQREAIMWSILNLGLSYGIQVYTDSSYSYAWWSKVNGNWNCVCNGGLTIGALAIANDDPTGRAAEILSHTVPNAAENCAMAVQSDGTWSETANYWYFGTTSHVEMASALLSSTGSTQELLTSNPAGNLSGLYHMYVTGAQGLFTYGDTGPNKYSATANGMMFYGSQYDIPTYTLFQRDRADAPEPMAMMWYDPQVQGDWWDGLALDHWFSNTNDAWVSMRSSWTDTNGLYVAMKSANGTDHQTHGDLDGGDFVLDAVGQRWAGELGSGNYLSDNYFASEANSAERWTYYRKRTEGQNTLVLDYANQNANAVPTTTYDSTGESQDTLAYSVPSTSSAYFTTDMSPLYNLSTGSVKRAIRTINGRRQVLIQDEVTVATNLQWRMHTNATITMSNKNQTATLTLGGKTLVALLISPSTAAFTTLQPVRYSTDPALPTDAGSQDQPNPGVTVLAIELGEGQQTIQVLFNPYWDNYSTSSFVAPPTVAIDSWTLTSHN